MEAATLTTTITEREGLELAASLLAGLAEQLPAGSPVASTMSRVAGEFKELSVLPELAA